ncbi:hypothetical protein AWN76_006620 [Rhodothermaceae bacterium RA]|nr:hypothetical protein AWN76_006620 [Rhodothermaceae bacterium RA]
MPVAALPLRPRTPSSLTPTYRPAPSPDARDPATAAGASRPARRRGWNLRPSHRRPPPARHRPPRPPGERPAGSGRRAPPCPDRGDPRRAGAPADRHERPGCRRLAAVPGRRRGAILAGGPLVLRRDLLLPPHRGSRRLLRDGLRPVPRPEAAGAGNHAGGHRCPGRASGPRPGRCRPAPRAPDARLPAGALGQSGRPQPVAGRGGGGPQHRDEAAQTAHLLANDTAAVVDHLGALGRPALIDVIADNAGFELVGDLCLVDYLLSSGQAASVRMHLKLHPTFVSDALVRDVAATIAYLRRTGPAAVQRLGERLRDHHRRGRLLLARHPYWTSPLSGWEMPTPVRAFLAPADLVISKGDANYRRWLGDRHWVFSLPFDQVVSYFPAPLVALRTVKAEVAAGIPPERLRRLDEADPDWMTNGHWGLIQFVR